MYITPKEAREHQNLYREKISLQPLQKKIQTVAGADISFNLGSNMLYAGIVVLAYPELTTVAHSLIVTEVDFPYIPGLLAFREIPALKKAWQQLDSKPDVVLLDGHGIAHPRRMGIATHFGIEVGCPTIGCAKNVLTGIYTEPDMKKGAYTYLKESGEKIGLVLRSRTNVKPIFISPGHMVSFDNTMSVVTKCLTKYKLPETTRKAHKLVNKLRRGEVEPGYSELK